MSPSTNASMLFFDTCEFDGFPDSVAVNGFPAMKDTKVVFSRYHCFPHYILWGKGNWHTHIPYYSARTREENDEEWQLSFRKPEKTKKRSKARMVDYPIATQPGISGGVLVVDQVVIGKAQNIWINERGYL